MMRRSVWRSAPEVDVQYGYDNSNRQTGLSVPGAGYNYTFGYDTMGRFETISSGGTLNFQYGYDNASNETLRRRAAGGASSVQFDQVYIPDELNRVTRRNLVRAGSMIAYEIYDYDPLRPGLMTSVTRQQPGQNPNQDVFGYDLLPELSSAQYGLQQGTGNGGEEPIGVLDLIALGDGSKDGGGDGGGEKLIEPDPNLQWVQPQRMVDYTWDKAGNRSNMNENITGGASTSTDYQVTNLNQYSQAGNDAVTNGNHHELANYQNTAYSYINDTHLCAITGGGYTYQLSYDGLGRCVVRMFDGVTNYYIYDGEKAILEYSTGYHVLAANLYGRGIDEILMRTDYRAPARTWFYQDDHEGSITQLTDGNGNIVETYRYDAFGKPAFWNGENPPRHIEGSNFFNRFLFTGREYMATFGIYEYRNRAYHPGLGRFMSEDSKLDADPTNLFRYCGNDPIDRTDPMGLEDLDKILKHQDGGTMEFANQRAADWSRGITRIGTNPWHPTAARVEAVKAAGDSGQKNNGRIEQDRESYDPARLPHTNDPFAKTREGASAAVAAEQTAGDKREYHIFTFQNPANKNDFVCTPVHISGKNGPTNETTILVPDSTGHRLVPIATVGNYKLWGVGMNHVRYNKTQLNRDLANFRKNDITGVIMTPSPTSGSGIHSEPPYYYDAEKNSTYGPR
jgi:RHS repeat-associated protein